MNTKLRRRALALAVVLLVPGSAMAQQPDTLDLGIIADQVLPRLLPLLDGMVEEIDNVVGGQAVIRLSDENLVSADLDRERARQAYEAMLAGEPDIIMTFGPITNEVVASRESFPKPTMAVGGLYRELALVDLDSPTSGIPNFTVVVSSRSFAQDLSTFKSLIDFQNLGVITPGIEEYLGPISDAFAQAAEESGVDYELIPYSSPASLEPYLDRVDAVYLTESLYLSRDDVADLAQALLSAGIPSFSGTRREDVELGIMATNQGREEFGRLFRRIALNVEAVVNGEDLSTRPVLIEASETLTMNFSTSLAVGVQPSFELLTSTEFVGDYQNLLAEEQYDLPGLVREAIGRNPGLRSDSLAVRLADQEVTASWSNYLPSVAAEATGNIVDPDLAELSRGQNPEYSTSGQLSLSQVLFSPDANANISIQRSLARAQVEELRRSELDLALEAGNAYFNALLAKAAVQIRNQNLAATRQNLRIAEENYAAGQSGRGDVLRLESEAAQDLQAFLEAVTQFRQSLHVVNRLLNQPIGRRIDVQEISVEGGMPRAPDALQFRQILDDPVLRSDFEEFLVQEAIDIAPELEALDHTLDATSRVVRLNGLQRYLPTVAGGVELNHTFDRWGKGTPAPGTTLDQYYAVGLRASIPVFDSNLRRVDRQRARIQAEQLQTDRKAAADLIEQRVRDIVLETMNQLASLELAVVSAEAAAESLNLAQASYTEGALTLVELLDVQTNHLNAELSLAASTYTLLATTLAVQRLVGHYFILSSEAENQAFMERFSAFRAARMQ